MRIENNKDELEKRLGMIGERKNSGDYDRLLPSEKKANEKEEKEIKEKLKYYDQSEKSGQENKANKQESKENIDKKLGEIENRLSPPGGKNLETKVEKPKESKDELEKRLDMIGERKNSCDYDRLLPSEKKANEKEEKEIKEKLKYYDQSEKSCQENKANKQESKENIDKKLGEIENRLSPPGRKNLENKVEKPKESKDELEKRDFSELDSKVIEIVKPYCDKARDIARADKEGRAFTGHTEKHIYQVAEKSQEVADALEVSIDNSTLFNKDTIENNENDSDRFNFKSDIDRNALHAAALSHDTGMSGGYKVTETKIEGGKTQYGISTCETFKDIRNNHSLNSCINVLENRGKYKEIGFSDEQIDSIASLCMAHSKTNSGVKDLNSKEEWGKCFDKIEATIEAYNKQHQGKVILFNRSAFEQSEEKLGKLVTSTQALRLGDVSRDSHSNDESQSGEYVHVDRSTINDKATNWEDEVRNVNVDINGDKVDSEKSKQVHIGEQNVINNQSYNNDDGKFTHEITINDMNSGKLCTREAIKDHITEFSKDVNANIVIKFEGECLEENKNSYNDLIEDFETVYENINIIYPWDK